MSGLNKSSKSSPKVAVFAVLFLIAIFGVVVTAFFGWAPLADFWRRARISMYIWLPLGAIAGLGILALGAHGTRAKTLFRATALLTVASIVGTGFLWVRYGYDLDRAYASDIKVTDESVPSFADRAPFDVAVQSSHRNLQNTTGDALNVRMLASEGENGLWNALVVRRGFTQGYEAVQSMNVPLYGNIRNNEINMCKFDAKNAKLRLGGHLPGNNLSRALRWKVGFNTTFDPADVYGYCDGKTPMVVLPLKHFSGFFHVSYTAAGVATYNGSTGELKVLRDPKGIPGPVYPMTLVRKTRESAAALGDFSSYFWKRSGYEDTSKDNGNVNGANGSEFSLRGSGNDDNYYVTPLTIRGSSSSISAIGESDASVSKYGQRNKFIIHRLDPVRDAISTSQQNIRTQNSYLPWYSGIEIFEIVPGADNTFVASIGQAQEVSYRVVLTADGTTTLYKDGKVVTSTDSNTPTDGDMGTSDDNVNLETMTPAQLAELSKKISDRLAQLATQGANQK